MDQFKKARQDTLTNLLDALKDQLKDMDTPLIKATGITDLSSWPEDYVQEKDRRGDVMMVWSYPTMSSDHCQMYLRKCSLSAHEQKDSPELGYGQLQHTWHYLHTARRQSEKLPQVEGVCIVLVTRDFHPEKYDVLAAVLTESYMSSGTPASLLESFLGVFTQGVCQGTGSHGSPPDNDSVKAFSVEDYNPRHALINCSIKDVIIQFGLETILIYTALILKKRVAVYHSKLRPLLAFTRALPILVWHRQDWSILYPWVTLNDMELADLQKRTTYIAGFTDSTIEAKINLYDVLVNLTTSEITIAQHAKATLAMGKLHKDIAMFMVQCVDESEKTQKQMIKEISVKTKELLTNLQSLASEGEDGKPYITLESLKERKMPAATENFLFNLAAVEGLVHV